jgi:lipopolysaccharide biosynthesis glycosyltransferase
MKTLLYTVSDFKNSALDCIEMMLKNIKGSEFDFAIVSNKEVDCRHKIILDQKPYNYIGFLKYSENLPKEYDRYVYLDSDILYFGQINELFAENKEFSIVREKLKMSNEWFKYPYLNTPDYLSKINNVFGLNAGTFSFKDVSFLKNVRSLFEPFISQEIHQDARLEQSSFNFALSREVDFNFSKCYDLTDISVLFADQSSYQSDKLLYHFCGFSNEMQSKLFKMKNFYDKISI